MALYDPNEFPAEVTKDFTLDDVLAWARTKPADESYDFYAIRQCAICQFLKDTGRAIGPVVDEFCWSEGLVAATHPYDARVNDAAANDHDAKGWTFGAFADRLEAELRK